MTVPNIRNGPFCVDLRSILNGGPLNNVQTNRLQTEKFVSFQRTRSKCFLRFHK